MQVDLLGGSYQAKYLNFNTERSINWYPVIKSQSEKGDISLVMYPTPGNFVFVSLPGNTLRNLFTVRTFNQSRCFAIVDTTLYEIQAHGAYTSRGNITNCLSGTTKIFACVNNNNELFITNYSSSYTLDLDTNVLTEVTGDEVPTHNTYLTELDGYMVVVTDSIVAFSDNQAVTWTGTNQYETTFKPAPVIAVEAFQEQIYNFTAETIEVYINDGTTYTRLPRSTKYIGIVAKESLIVDSEGFIFLGRSHEGQSGVFMFDGFNSPIMISDPGVNWRINNSNDTLEDSYAFLQYTKDGHAWYHLSVPTLNTTFVYDKQTKMWFERQSLNPTSDSDGTQVMGVFRGRYYTNFNGKNLYADKYSTNILLEDYALNTETSQALIKTRISPTIEQELQLISTQMLEIDCSAGLTVEDAPVLMYEMSRNNGYTYINQRNIELGQQGEYDFRAVVYKLGSSYRWTIKLSCADDVSLMLKNFVAHGTIGIF